MASFDIVSKVDAQLLDNTVNVSLKEITNRYDFRDSATKLELNKKDLIIDLETENDMRVKAIEDILISRAVKQGIDGRSFDFTADVVPSGKMVRKTIKVKSGIEKEVAKKILKLIKDSKIKVEAQQMDDRLRVTSKKIDDLQAVISLLRTAEVGQPLQFVNMK